MNCQDLSFANDRLLLSLFGVQFLWNMIDCLYSYVCNGFWGRMCCLVLRLHTSKSWKTTDIHSQFLLVQYFLFNVTITLLKLCDVLQQWSKTVSLAFRVPFSHFWGIQCLTKKIIIFFFWRGVQKFCATYSLLFFCCIWKERRHFFKKRGEWVAAV